MMRRLSTTAAVLITAGLALLLIAYVFAIDTPAHSIGKPHCSSRPSLDRVKHELFRRATTLRGTNDQDLSQVANYSVLRTASRMFRRHHRGSDKVTCTGSISVDLPPGVAVADGRRSLTSQVLYELKPGRDGAAQLLMLSRADAIVLPLATISEAGSRKDQPVSSAHEVAEEGAALAAAEPSPSEQPTRAAPPPARPRTSSVARVPAQSSVPRGQPSSSVATPTRPPRSIATATPSFNCRYARTRGEIAVCNDPGLAALDRQMASQFYSALSAARPGQRAMLQRTRGQFLRHRDACASESCIADAYRARMREIGNIMAGQW